MVCTVSVKYSNSVFPLFCNEYQELQIVTVFQFDVDVSCFSSVTEVTFKKRQ